MRPGPTGGGLIFMRRRSAGLSRAPSWCGRKSVGFCLRGGGCGVESEGTRRHAFAEGFLSFFLQQIEVAMGKKEFVRRWPIALTGGTLGSWGRVNVFRSWAGAVYRPHGRRRTLWAHAQRQQRPQRRLPCKCKIRYAGPCRWRGFFSDKCTGAHGIPRGCIAESSGTSSGLEVDAPLQPRPSFRFARGTGRARALL